MMVMMMMMCVCVCVCVFFFSFLGLRMQVALGGSNNGEESGDQQVVAAAAQKAVIEKVHVSSVILAAHSDYFMRLFSNGMIESNSESATVQVTEEGEDL
jgi:proteasome assembly chaperone (PAC2) family protein